MFISKDELFKRVQQKFKAMIRHKGRRLQVKESKAIGKVEVWGKAEEEIRKLLDKIRENFSMQN